MTLNKTFITAPLALLSLLPFAAGAQQAPQEMARVISSTPVTQQVAIPQQVCSNSPVLVQPPKSGAGAAMGAIAGGAIGSQIGGGAGRALAIGAGVIGGAILGDRVEGQPAPVAQTVTSCSQQVRYENQVVAYNVVYEYAGRQYSTQTSTPPGEWMPLQVSPAGSAPVQMVATPPAPAPVVVTQPVVTTYPPVIYGPTPYPAPYYYGPGISIRYGYGGGWHGRHWH